MLETEIFAVAARLHVVMRRSLGRVTDVQWMTKNRDYAFEIIRLAREKADPELLDLAAKLEALLVARQQGPMPVQAATGPGHAPAPAPASRPAAEPAASRYVGSLR